MVTELWSGTPYLKVCGGYIITHEQTGKFYIFTAFDVADAVQAHRGALKERRHPSAVLQELYDRDPTFRVDTVGMLPSYLSRESMLKVLAEIERILLGQNKHNRNCLNHSETIATPEIILNE